MAVEAHQGCSSRGGARHSSLISDPLSICFPICLGLLNVRCVYAAALWFFVFFEGIYRNIHGKDEGWQGIAVRPQEASESTYYRKK